MYETGDSKQSGKSCLLDIKVFGKIIYISENSVF